MTRPIRASPTDACPGALRLHAAADGPLARVRLPGGMLTGAQLATLGEIAADWGDGGLELTSRANVQLRALNRTNPAELAARLFAAGLLPSQTHETVRNIAAPALATPALRALVVALDHALCADPALAALPGRFLFAIGRVPLTADVAAIPLSPTGDWAILPAGNDEGLRVPAARAVEALLAGAHAFLAERAGTETPSAWRLAELPDGPRRVAGRVAAALGLPLAHASTTAGGLAATLGKSVIPEMSPGLSHSWPAGADGPAVEADGPAVKADGPAVKADGPAVKADGPAVKADGPAVEADGPLVGVVEQADGLVAVGALVPLGRLTGVQVKVLTEAQRLVFTPSRGVVVPDLAPAAAGGWLAALADADLPVQADSRWAGVTACAGRPGCAKSLADVRADALAATTFAEGLPVHWVGCARGCGSPSGAHVRVEATGDGYAVTAAGLAGDRETFSHRRLAEIIAAARRS